ncbi:hypothetical protein A2U01_0061058, partial [Trifolium medium]|nr:hypothetical protein [Trifolium medium]
FATRWPPFLRIHDRIARQASDVKQARDLRVTDRQASGRARGSK